MLQWSEEINVFSAGSPMMSVHRQGGKSMIWKIDQATALAAMTYMPLQDQDAPVLQFGGCHTSAETWNDRVLQPSTWPNEPLWSSPEEIIKQLPTNATRKRWLWLCPGEGWDVDQRIFMANVKETPSC
jgi:hypothetical protein